MKCLSVCLKVPHTRTKKNANNAHKYDCSPPKKGNKKNEPQQKKVKKKVNVTGYNTHREKMI